MFFAFDTNNLLLFLVRNKISPLGISLLRQFSLLGEHIKTNFGSEDVKSLLTGNVYQCDECHDANCNHVHLFSYEHISGTNPIS